MTETSVLYQSGALSNQTYTMHRDDVRKIDIYVDKWLGGNTISSASVENSGCSASVSHSGHVVSLTLQGVHSKTCWARIKLSDSAGRVVNPKVRIDRRYDYGLYNDYNC